MTISGGDDGSKMSRFCWKPMTEAGVALRVEVARDVEQTPVAA